MAVTVGWALYLEGSQAGLEMLLNGSGEELGPTVAAVLRLEGTPKEQSEEAT